MDNIIAIAGALAVILSGVAVFVVVAQRRTRAIQAAGFVELKTADEALNELTRAIFEATPREVHHKEDAGEQSWLIFADTGSSEDSGCAMLVYRTGHDNWPAVVLVQSGRRIPKMFRQLTGGFFKWAEPMTDREFGRLAGTGWFAYKEPKRDVPPVLIDRLGQAIRIPDAQGLLGVAVRGSYLSIWCETGKLRTLLAAAPLVRATVLERTGAS